MIFETLLDYFRKTFSKCSISHSWQVIYKKEENRFLGTDIVSNVRTNFRICKICNKIQEYEYDSQGGYWFTLTKQYSDIVKTHIDHNIFYIKIKETNE